MIRRLTGRLGLPATRRDLLIIYFSVVAVLGIFLVYRATPMSGIDEMYHFKRAVQISQGVFLARTLGPNNFGGKLDSRLLAYERWFDDRRNSSRQSVAAEIAEATAAVATQPAHREMDSFPSTASYPPLPYLPSALALSVTKGLGLGVAAQVLAGRLASFAAWLGLVGLVVRVLPAGRFGALALMTMPAAIGVAASYSADPVTNGLSILFVAICLHLRLVPTTSFGRGRKIGLLSLALCLGLLKLTCALLSIAVVLLPDDRFRSRRMAWAFKASAIGVAFGVAATWNLHYKFVPGMYWGYGANPHLAVQMILAAPAHHVWLVISNIQASFYTYWSDAFARFGNGPLPLWLWFNGVTTEVALLFLFGIVLAEPRPDWRPWTGIFLASLAVLYAVQTVIAFKIGFSSPESTVIAGVQGRYWIVPYALFYVGTVLIAPAVPWARFALVPCMSVLLATDVDFVLAALRGYAANWH